MVGSPWRKSDSQARNVTIAALAAGTRTCNPVRVLLTSSSRAGFHRPAGDASAPPRVMPDLLSSEDPERRKMDPLRTVADVSIRTTTSVDGSLLINVRTVRLLADWVAYAVMFLF